MNKSEMYGNILKLSPFGYSLHKIILDKKGVPYDYEYIETNASFIKLTGLENKTIIGKTVRKLFPGIENDKFDWIAYYGDIAINGGIKEFEQYFDNLKKWYKVQVYSPEKYYFTTIFVDITTEKEKNNELETFFTLNLDLLCIADFDGNFIKVNKEWENILGYPASYLESKKFLDFVHPDDMRDTLDTISSLAMNKKVINFVNRYRSKDGKYKYIEWRSNPHGKYIYAAARDITEHRNMLNGIKVTKEKIELLSDSIPTQIWYLTDPQTYGTVNKAHAEFLGKDKSDIENKSLYELLPEREAGVCYLSNRKVFDEKKTIVTEELVADNKGNRLLLRVVKTPKLNSNNEVEFVVCSAEDITQQKEAENVIKENNKLLDLFFRQSMSGFFFMMLDNPVEWNDRVDKDKVLEYVFKNQRITKVNKAMLDQYNANENDFVGKTPAEFFSHDLEYGKKVWTDFFNNGHLHIDTVEKKLSGLPLHIEGDYICLYDSVGRITGHFGVQIDVTDKKMAEERLNQERSLFSQGPVFTMIKGTSAGFPVIYVSDNIKDILGYKPDEIYNSGFKFSDIIHPEDRGEVQKKLDQHLTTKSENFDLSFRLRLKSGEYRWFYEFSRIILDKEEKPSIIRGYLFDQTHIKDIESELIAERERLDNIIMGTNVGTWQWNVQTGETEFNERWAEIIGYTLEEIGPMSIETWAKYAHPEDLKKSGDILQRHFAGEIDYYACESRMKHKNGSWVWVLDRGRVAQWTQDGKPLLMFGTHQDITDRKYFEIEMSTILETAADGIFISDDKGRIINVNSSLCRILGYSKDELLSMSIADIESNETEEDIINHIENIFQKGYDSFDTVHIRKDGSLINVEISVTKLDITVRKIVSFVRDVTEKREAQQKLIEYAETIELKNIELDSALLKAKSASKAKSEFLANMSHEIRTPLNGVIGFTELLKNTPLSQIQLQFVDNAIISAKTLLDVINDILDFSKIEAGKVELDILEEDIYTLIEESTDIIKYQSAKKGLELLLNIDPSMPRYVMIDRVRLKQILINLLSNAVKFTEKGEVELKLVFEKIDDKTGIYIFTVRDTGIGISEESQKNLFKAFTQADSSTTRRFGGTGLGLVISNLLVEKMGGTIEINSKEGEGSSFYFSITAEYKSGALEDIQNEPAVESVLVVDDNLNNRTIIKHQLLNRNIVCGECDRGEVVIGELKENHYDIVIVDYEMPGINGLETIRRIRTDADSSINGIPVMLLHSYFDQDFIEEKQKLNINLVATKPIIPNQLFKYLSNIKNKVKSSPVFDKVYHKTDRLKVKDKPEILIAEDVSMNMLLIKTLIFDFIPDAVIHEAENGSVAVRLSNKNAFDLILMDIQMPLMDGLEATRLIKSNSKYKYNLPVVALTAGALKEEKDKCFDAGMDDFLTKPIDKGELKDILLKYLPIQAEANDHEKTDTPIDTVGTLSFDRKRLTERLGFDEGFVDKIIDDGQREISAYLNELRIAFKKKNLHQIESIGLKIEIAARNLCLDNMAEIVKNINRDDGLTYKEGIFDQMISEWLRIKRSGWK